MDAAPGCAEGARRRAAEDPQRAVVVEVVVGPDDEVGTVVAVHVAERERARVEATVQVLHVARGQPGRRAAEELDLDVGAVEGRREIGPAVAVDGARGRARWTWAGATTLPSLTAPSPSSGPGSRSGRACRPVLLP